MLQLLTVFVSGNLAQYSKFYEQNKDYIASIGKNSKISGILSVKFNIVSFWNVPMLHHSGLDHEQNMRKMRLLTFMQMCEGKTELDYNFVQDELKFEGQDDLEEFIIEGESNAAHR